MDDKLAIYQLHVQSADKLDGQRGASVLAYGAMCVVLTTAAVAAFERFPLPAAVLWALLALVAFAWLATLHSLTAKLKAKSRVLTEMEDSQEVPSAFLNRERKHWETLRRPALAKVLQHAPWAFLLVGVRGTLGTLAHFAWTTLRLCP